VRDGSLIGPDGWIRDDDEAVARVTSALRRDSGVTALVEDVGSRHVARGAFALLVPARLRSSGRDVLVKVNANAHERAWLPAIGELDPDVVPAVFGSGDAIDDVPLGWMVMERLPYQPPGFAGAEWYGSLIRAAFRWQDAARRVEVPVVHAVDGAWLTSWMDAAVELDGSPGVRRLRDRFDDDWAWVSERCPSEPCHGDVHFFNAGSREPGLPESLVLFDPIPRLAPWPYDPAHCETLTNYALVVPDGEPLVLHTARHRRELGLPTPDDDDVLRISALFCAWLAVMWRALFRDKQPDRRETSARHVDRYLAAVDTDRR
jgi:hypothetical protein